MKTKTLSTILACGSLLLIRGSDSNSSYKNGTVDSSRRIINGEIANPADFRFLVLLEIPVGEKTSICGGSIVSNHFILTAGHCLYNRRCETMEIYPSTWASGDSSELHPSNCYTHEMANGRDYYYDIGLMKTEEDLLVDERFAKIDLPPPDAIFAPGDESTIAGWGAIKDGSMPDHLMRAEVPVSSWDECNNAYVTADKCADNMICPLVRLPDRTFCTLGTPSKFSSPCLGDSGGPVIIDGMLAGVMSGIILLDKLHCDFESPGLNQDVSEFVPWIRSHIQSDTDRSYIPVAHQYS